MLLQVVLRVNLISSCIQHRRVQLRCLHRQDGPCVLRLVNSYMDVGVNPQHEPGRRGEKLTGELIGEQQDSIYAR